MAEQSKNITAFGEILWDVYPDKKRLGGAPFNFIYHIWKILGKSNFISSVGNDENGKEILNFLYSIGFNTDYILIDNEHPTGTVLVELDENKSPRFTPTYNCCYDFIQPEKQFINSALQAAELIYFGTFSARSEVTKKTLLSLLEFPDKKYFCDLNLRHNFYTKDLVERALIAATVLKINEMELEKLRELFDLSADHNEACNFLLSKYKIEIIGLTLGENGAYIYSRNENDHYKSPPSKIIDTLGAGDAFAAMLCIGYLNNIPLKKLNRLANEFALEICKVSGALPPDNLYNKYRLLFA